VASLRYYPVFDSCRLVAGPPTEIRTGHLRSISQIVLNGKVTHVVLRILVSLMIEVIDQFHALLAFIEGFDVSAACDFRLCFLRCCVL
jgi:hypothetical protein